ncbi:MAG: CDP-alcohol phosphatidyltransferase [Rhodospirillaceae bacterium]|nr:CDP-alcohol phosphatidyltransferase [Rhodospirillaceae bacterium]
MNLPNAISLGRFMSVPVAVLLILFDRYQEALWLFVVAALSDAVDGFIAKQFDMATTLGAYLDPIADKSLLVGVYIALAHEGALPVWLVILVCFRDLSIVGGVLLLHALTATKHIVEPMILSKINTLAQLVLAGLTLAALAYGWDDRGAATLMVYAVAATTVGSGFAYLVRMLQRGDLEGVP